MVTVGSSANASAVRATAAALCANLVGIGLARFGYTPLIPAVIAAGWFAPSAAVYLGAANLAGYLAGALAARRVSARPGAALTLRTAMLLTAVSLLACTLQLGFWWFFGWRFISGATGGILMALAAPTVLPAIPPSRRGLAGGIVFTGVGLGIAASGTLVPALIHAGVREAWSGLGAMCLVLTAFAWHGWPGGEAGSPHSAPTRQASFSRPLPLRALYLEYALNAVGLVPHMVFLVDFVARGLGRGLSSGASCWVVFGVGALAGPVTAGHVGDRIGFGATLRAALLIQAAAVAFPLVSTSTPALWLSSFIVGAFVPGIVAITIGRTRELSRGDTTAQTNAWAYCTTAFAIGQALAGYVFSYIFAHSPDPYPILFALAAAAILLALGLDLLAGTIGDRTARADHSTIR